MNRTLAKKIAETITNEQLGQMLKLAKENIKDWTKVSSVNKGMTKGVAWNILAADFDVTHSYHILAKINMIREFGEFLPGELLKNLRKESPNDKPLVHQEPKLDTFDF